MDAAGKKKLIKKSLYILGSVAALFLLIKYGMRWLGPFLLAVGTAALLEKPVMYLHGRGWKRGFASAACTLLFFGLFLGGAVLLIWFLGAELGAFLRQLPGLLEELCFAVEEIIQGAEGITDRLPPAVSQAVSDAIREGVRKLQEIPGKLAGKLPERAAALVRRAPGALLFFVTYAAGTFFIGAGFPLVKAFLFRQLPAAVQKKLQGVRGEAFSALSTWLGAQLRLMVVTFLTMTAGFWLLGIRYGALLALLVALVDALPVLGTGVVLTPWAIGEMILGNPLRALALMLLYALAALTRSFLEPRLIGGKLGLHPAASLFAMYSGFCFAGVAGMILFPMGLLVAKQLSDKEYLRLWRKI